jgi:hypothetical protein
METSGLRTQDYAQKPQRNYVQELGLSTFSNKSGTSENTYVYIISLLPCSISRKKEVMRSKIGKGRVSFLGPEVRT